MRASILAAVVLAALAGPALAADRPTIAITFDDLPAHGLLPPGVTRLDVANTVIAALKAHGIKSANGFVNGSFGADDPLSPQVLAAWRAAGYPLGNHSFSHPDLENTAAADFEADVIRNEPLLRKYMAGGGWRWFRYPFLSEGSDPAKQREVRRFLGQHRYSVAAVTMSFGDYAWNTLYARCAAKGDAAAVARLETSFLAAARDTATRMRALSQAAEGRDIPYVLLMHIGAFDAHMLPRLLDQYAAMGFGFTPLADVQRDRFYAAALDLKAPGPSPTLEAAATAKDIAVPPPVPLPDDSICA